jgi:hypothetical protein
VIEVGNIVTIEGEQGNWKVDMAGNASPMVRVIQNRNAATWKMVDQAKLTLVSKAVVIDGSPRLIPARGILD